MKFIEQIDIRDKRVLVRVDYNVPIQDGEVVNDYRIRRSLDTINYCLENNASVVLISHLGRPKGVKSESLSLEPISWCLEDLLNQEVNFIDDCISEEAVDASYKLKSKEVLLLENLRFYNEELENTVLFSKTLSKLGDIYINDAFGTAHRSHSSNVGITTYLNNKGYGFLIRDEIEYLKKTIDMPSKPLTFIIGGSKISTKISLFDNIVDKADVILVGGAMAFNFLEALGYNVGSSLVEKEYVPTAKKILEKCKKIGVNLQLPIDVVCTKDLKSHDDIDVKLIDELSDDDIGFDVGPETCINYNMFIQSSKTLIWNGPVGLFEDTRFSTGTQDIANSLAEAGKKNQATVIIGGGDTVTAIDSFNPNLEYSHISTGGGSTLELLSGKELPALTALEE